MKYTISPAEIDILAPFINQLTGLVLDHSKAYLFETRLGPVLEKYSLSSFSDLISGIALNRVIEREVINAITTQETLFFRDRAPFEYLKNKFVPEFFEKNGMSAPLNIWSAASSTGQEIYSIAMTLQDILFDLEKYNLSLHATDISDEAISRASLGRYNKFELSRGLDSRLMNKYFERVGDDWKIIDEIRAKVHFRQLNLLKPITNLAKQDIIFCRNVAIYFSREDRQKLYNKLADQLKPEGVLIISSTESLLGICDRFEKLQFRDAIYYKKLN
jgi:chemotaxis protein methyltransferase CheR